MTTGLLFASAEGLTRRAFPQQIRFFSVTNVDVAVSRAQLTSVGCGYLSLPVFFAFTATFYRAARHIGWWIPSSTMSDPNVLATLLPWYDCLAQATMAGVVEECLFRAVPIAGSVLLCRWYTGNQKVPVFWWLATFALQAIIFAAAHANYATQPAHARLVELLAPSVGFGILYVKLGLLSGIVLHVLYDVIWMALPVFLSENTYAKLAVALCCLIPLLLSIGAAIYQGGVFCAPVPTRFLNGGDTFSTEGDQPNARGYRGGHLGPIGMELPPQPIASFIRTALPAVFVLAL
eukprot:SAG31_NODE_7861_length_1581_cov_1.172740_2_plen_290_part_01